MPGKSHGWRSLVGCSPWAALGAQDDGVTRGVDVHGPCDTEVQDDAAFQTDESSGEIVHLELLSIVLHATVGIVGVVRTLAEEGRLVAGNGQGLGIADGIEDHVQGVAADIAQSAQACGAVFDEGGTEGSGDASAAAAAGLDVVDVAQDAGLDDLLDHLHVLVHTGLEADGNHLAGLLLGLADSDGLFQGDAHGLLQQDVQAGLQRVDGALGMGAVVGADADGVQVQGLVGQHLGVVAVALNAFHAQVCEELLSLAGDQVGTCHDLNVGLLQVADHVSLGDPAAADDTDADLLGSVNIAGGLYIFETIQNAFCHFCFPPFILI